MPVEMNAARNVFARVFDALLPRRCALCAARAERGFCGDCRQMLPWITRACEICGAELPAGAPGVCGGCQAEEPPSYDRAVIPFRYCEPVAGQIRLLKYRDQLGHAAALGAMLSLHARRARPPHPDALMPVPLHGKRLRLRGFNQAMEIAKSVGRELGIEVRHRELRRIKNTVPQVGLSHAARRSNVRGAFRASPLRGMHIALVDDVVTSGSTVDAAARALKRAGAETVSVWAVARA
ncbi:MAG: Competence protein F [Arenicellales bacterium IbO2]|nr:MAG: Competence protein F [Arenicellales bacterium IbO2]